MAKELRKYGVDIWYDEFELELGDSLSKSIDLGLSDSMYGLIILSPAFLEKKWTDYELKSLLAKEIYKGKIILPIWHNVTLEQVMERSLYLADKKAIKSDIGINKLAVEIVKIVRPDILSIWTIRNAFHKAKKDAPIKDIHFSQLTKNDRIHTSLPFHMVISSVMFQSIFPEVCSLQEMLDDFMRDVDYDSEFAVWAVISSAFIEVMRELDISFSDERCKGIFDCLLGLSLGRMEYGQAGLEEEEEQIVLQAYYRNAAIAFPFLDRYNLREIPE